METVCVSGVGSHAVGSGPQISIQLQDRSTTAVHETRPLLSPSPEQFIVAAIDSNFNIEWLDVSEQGDMASRSGPAPPPRQRPQVGPPGPGGLGAGGASAALTAAAEGMTDARAKTVLKEAVDAVVNSFAKHTRSYGRGT